MTRQNIKKIIGGSALFNAVVINMSWIAIAVILYLSYRLKKKDRETWGLARIRTCPDYWVDISNANTGTCYDVLEMGTDTKYRTSDHTEIELHNANNVTKYNFAVNEGVDWEGITYARSRQLNSEIQTHIDALVSQTV
jgi:hypothetical protein